MRIDVRGARLYDPALGLDRAADLLIEDGRIAGIGTGLPAGERTVWADGLLLTPGFVDLHVHLRDPGETYKEDLASGLGAALRGGFTDVCAMPNTRPPIDRPLVLREILQRAKGNPVRLHQLAAVTVGQEGERLSEMGNLVAAGAVAFSDDGHPVASSGTMRLALQYAQAFSAVLVTHAEDPAIARDGVMHEGAQSYALGLPGQPRSAESAMVARDLEILRDVGGRLHIAHVSTRETVELVRRAKSEGLGVTCEVTPHHLLLTADDVAVLGTLGKVNPPLREISDRDALRAGLVDGTIDAIATDHAPHSREEKAEGMLNAPFGAIGLETAFACVYDGLVRTGELSLARLVEAFTDAPRRAFGLPPARLQEGAQARMSLFDLCATWLVCAENLRSKSRNSPFPGRQVTGRAIGIISEGAFHATGD